MIIGRSLLTHTNTVAVSPFTSKFDAYLKGTYTLTADRAGRNTTCFAAKGIATHAIWTAGNRPNPTTTRWDCSKRRRHGCSSKRNACVHLLRFVQSGTAQESKGLVLL